MYEDEKLKNQNLEKKIAELEITKQNLENELKIEKEKNAQLESEKPKENDEKEKTKIIQLYDEISENQKEIKELKNKLSKYPFEILENEKLMSVIISTEDKNTQLSIISKNTEKFIKLEEKFYEAFPNFSQTENSFTVNGNKINKYQNLEENGINNSDIIIIKEN